MPYRTQIDTAGIAALIGCTRAHATNRITKLPDFPRPIVNLSRKMRRWSQAEVLAYIQGKRNGAKAVQPPHGPTHGNSY